MPESITAPRDLALELWLQGFTVPQVAKQLSLKPETIYSWKRRHGWIRPGPKPPSEAQTASLQGIAERLANLTLVQAERILCTIRDTKLEGLRDCKEASTALAASYATARKALGLDDAHPSLHVHYHGAGAPRPIGQPGQPGPVLDVPSSASGQD